MNEFAEQHQAPYNITEESLANVPDDIINSICEILELEPNNATYQDIINKTSEIQEALSGAERENDDSFSGMEYSVQLTQKLSAIDKLITENS